MVVHYKLFKHGTWFSHRAASDRCNIFDFCCRERSNPICEALSTFASMLLDPEGNGKRPLALLYLKFGERFLEWPRHVREYLQGSVCIAFQVLWRKLFHDFQCYPWLLAPAFDVGRSMIARRETIQRFLDAPECCLDKSFVHRCVPTQPTTVGISELCCTISWSRSLSGLWSRQHKWNCSLLHLLDGRKNRLASRRSRRNTRSTCLLRLSRGGATPCRFRLIPRTAAARSGCIHIDQESTIFMYLQKKSREAFGQVFKPIKPKFGRHPSS